ncbi:MAG: argB [Vampirovibrio sp.]|nr:argB [Vampirovibrio sp.]
MSAQATIKEGTSPAQIRELATRKAEILVEALPYLQTFHGKTVVVKYGGSVMAEGPAAQSILSDIALMRTVGIQPIVVHGGGPEISRTLQQLGKQPQFVSGLRVTDDDAIAVVDMVLVGQVNKRIVAQLQTLGVQAVGLCGKDTHLLVAQKKLTNGPDLGWVGSVQQVNPKLIHVLLESGMIPVIASVGMDRQGQSYNINADEVAVAIAQAMQAEKLVYLTDVPGVLADAGNPESVFSTLTVAEAEQAILDGQITGGMIPKVQSAIQTVCQGVKSVHILDGRVPHALLLEIFTHHGVGTMIQNAGSKSGELSYQFMNEGGKR